MNVLNRTFLYDNLTLVRIRNDLKKMSTSLFQLKVIPFGNICTMSYVIKSHTNHLKH